MCAHDALLHRAAGGARSASSLFLARRRGQNRRNTKQSDDESKTTTRRTSSRRDAAMKISSLFGFVVLSSSPSKIAFGRDDGQQRRREFVTDGYALELPEGYTAEESEGVATSTATIRDATTGTSVAQIRRERTGTMGNYGLRSMFSNVDSFGEQMKGQYDDDGTTEEEEEEGQKKSKSRRGPKELEQSGMYAIELSENRIVGVVVGCKDGENGRKFNQLQTIRAFARVENERKAEDVWEMLESLRLTTGKTCG